MPNTVARLQSASDRLVEVVAMLHETRERVASLTHPTDRIEYIDCVNDMLRHIDEGIQLARNFAQRTREQIDQRRRPLSAPADPADPSR
jgi:hypothetical protein